CGPPVAPSAHSAAHLGGDGTVAPGNATNTRSLDRAPTGRSRRPVPGEGHCISGGDGRARPVPPAVPGLRVAGPADPLRRKRSELLRHLPDRWPAPRRPLIVPLVEGGLAAVARRVGGARRPVAVSLRHDDAACPIRTRLSREPGGYRRP